MSSLYCHIMAYLFMQSKKQKNK